MNNTNYISKELVSLIHNIELNRSGWWNVALQRLIIGALWLSDQDLSSQQISDFLHTNLHISVDTHRIQAQAKVLCDSGTLIPMEDNKLRLPESTKLDFEDEIKRAEDISNHAQREFIKILSEECQNLDAEQVWLDLNSKLLIPAIRQMGVRFYAFLTGDKGDIGQMAVFDDFLTSYPRPSHNQLRLVVTKYFSTKDSRIRSFILRQLYTSLIIEANNLDEETILKFSNINKKRLVFKVFVDTNFIFSLFGVHDNPFNEDARTLLSLIENIPDSISTKLYVAPITINETRQAIQNSIDYYNSVRLSPNMAKASLQSADIGGFLRKLAIEAEKSGKTITAQDYYGPYKNDLIRILRSNGIELYNTDLSEYRKNQSVIDDILAQLEFEREKYGSRAKSYEKAQHDIVLWHFVNDKRPPDAESPADAEYWIVTVDFRFLGFDAYKRRFNGSELPICLLPSQLIQLLQFWIPRTPQFEEALFESWLWPLIFQEIDKEAEQVTVKILNALSRYENIQDLPDEVVSQVLFNDALRQRIALEPNINKQVEMVESALVESHRVISQNLDATRKEILRRENEIAKLQQLIRAKERDFQKQQVEARQKDEQIKLLSQELQKIKSETNELQKMFQEKQHEDKVRAIQRSFVYKAMGYLLGILLLAAILTVFSQSFLAMAIWQVFSVYSALALIVWIMFVDRMGMNTEYIVQWALFIQFRAIKKWLFGGLGFILIVLLENAIGDLIWEPLKRLLPK